MSQRLQGTLVIVVGGTATYLAASGRFLDYLKPGMRFPLLGAGLVMVVLGVLTLLRSRSPQAGTTPAAGPVVLGLDDHADHGHGHGHGHHGGPVVAWLLVLPVLALVLIRPPALGADAARRETSTRLPTAAERGFDPLPPARDGAVDLALIEFLTRSYFDRQESLADIQVRLVGFVVTDPSLPDGYRLTRFRMSCCAADAFSIAVNLRGLDGPPPPDDTWVEVVGRWIPPEDSGARGADRGAELTVTAQTPVPAPADPYE